MPWTRAIRIQPRSSGDSSPRAEESGSRSGGSAFKRCAIPVRERGSDVVGAIDERVNRVVWRRRLPHRFVWKNKFAELAVVVSALGPHAGVLEPDGLRYGIAIEGRLEHRSASRPEPVADHFVRVRIAHERRALARRRGAAGKPRDGQIETAPEEMHRAALADERAARGAEYALDLHQDSPEPIGLLG